MNNDYSTLQNKEQLKPGLKSCVCGNPDTFSDCRGMTLVEIMIALALLTIVAAGVMGSFTALFASNRAVTSSTEVQAATELVMQNLETVEFTQLPSWDGATVDENGVTVGIQVTQVSPTVLQVETAGVKPGRDGGQFTLVTLRASR